MRGFSNNYKGMNMKKFLVILAVLSLAQVFAAPNPNSPISSAQIDTQSMRTKKTPALRSTGTQKGGGAVTPGPSPKESQPGSTSKSSNESRTTDNLSGSGGDAATPSNSNQNTHTTTNTNQGTGVQGVAISAMTQLPVASSASGVAAGISGAANLPPLLFNCF